MLNKRLPRRACCWLGVVAGTLVAFGAMSVAGAQQGDGTAGVRGPENAAAKAPNAPLSKLMGVALPGDGLPTFTLGVLDNAALIAQDDAQVANGEFDRPLRVSVPNPIAFDFASGQWFDVPGRGRLWVAQVRSEGAYGLRLEFSSFNLPAGAMMSVSAPSRPDASQGLYEGKGPGEAGSFWAGTTFEETARVELFVPAGVELANVPFVISGVQHMYRDPVTGAGSIGDRALPCEQDVTCYPAFANVAAGVARMYYVDGGGFVCTGQLLNALNGDLTPYFLTANHCISTNSVAHTLECYWYYQTSVCNGAVPDINTVPRSDYATLLSTGTPSDYSFLMVEGTIPRNLYWEGWTLSMPSVGETVYGVHHPGGEFKRYFAGSAATSPTCAGSTNADHIRVNYTNGTTEPGSSGSAEYRNFGGGDYRVVGQLHCGRSACVVDPAENRGSYGRLDVSYNAGINAYLGAGSDDGYEVNNTCATARNLGGVGNTYWGYLTVKSTNEDWYKVTVPAGGTVTPSLSFTHAWGDVDVTMFDACGGALVASSTGTGNSESFTYTNTTGFARDYYIHVYLYNDTRNYYNFSTNVQAAPVPATDSCGSAQTIFDGGTYTGTTVGASLDGADTCRTGEGPDVWYKYTATCDGVMVVDTFGSGYDTILSAHTGCPGNTGNQVACNDDTGGLQSQIVFSVTRNTTYRIRVSGYNGAAGNFTLHANLSRPSNDNCAGFVTIGSGVYSFNSCGCTTDGPAESACAYFGYPQVDNDFWVRWYADCNGDATVTTCGSTFDTKIAVYPGSCPSGPESTLACDDDSCGLQSIVTFRVVAGQPYLLRFGGFNGAAGSGTLSISCSTITCPADFDGDGTVDFFDYDAFVNCFEGIVCPPGKTADFDGDGTVDFFDYDAFVVAFETPC
ncbi:MAG: PPC domain-containing protein [Planctomycetota bacterium]